MTDALKKPRRSRRAVIAVLLLLYGLGLAWGYLRLPWAAVKGLSDYGLVADAPAVSFRELDVSAAQRWYLRTALAESPVPAVPRVSAAVKWNALVVARVASGHYVGPTGAEWRDGLYVCLFGAWVPVYTFSQEMA